MTLKEECEDDFTYTVTFRLIFFTVMFGLVPDISIHCRLSVAPGGSPATFGLHYFNVTFGLVPEVSHHRVLCSKRSPAFAEDDVKGRVRG